MYPKIKKLRKEKQCSQKDIAKALGITRVKYACYESGFRELTSEIAVKLALFYNTSVDYIVGFTDDPTPHERGKVLLDIAEQYGLDITIEKK